MSDTTPPGPPFARRFPAYYQLIHDLTVRLPPPVNDTPDALYARNQAAIEKVAAMLPVNPFEADLAVLYVATRAQADDAMRLTRVHAGDIQLVMKLNAQYISMVRTALSAQAQLLKVQALRHKREAIDAAREADAWTQHVAASSMQHALDPGSTPAAGEPPAPADAAPPSRSVDPQAQQPEDVAVPLAERRGQQRDLVAEAEHYAIVYPRRARDIRYCGGLPGDCTYGPPDDELVYAIVTGTTPALRALGPHSAVA